MKKHTWLIILLISNTLFSQNASLTNEIYNFSKLDFSQVDEYTGKASTSINIATIELDDIKIPISIDYLMGGIKINELASPVGLGWYLNAGGRVNKTVKGVDDNKIDYYATSSGINYQNRGILVEPSNYEKDIPDEYSANLAFLKTKFIIKKDFTIAELENFNEHKISINRGYTDPNISKKYGFIKDYYGSRYVCGERYIYNYLLTANSLNGTNCPYTHSNYIDIQGIEINDNGYLYKFNDWDHTFEISMLSTTKPTSSFESYHSAYNLSSLTSLKSNKKINFSYNTIVEHDYDNPIKEKIWNSYIPGDYQGDVIRYEEVIDYEITLPQVYFIQRIEKITSDEMIIEFNYENSRLDLNASDLEYTSPNYLKKRNGQLLKSIYIKDPISGKIVWTYAFTYSYFNSGCDTNNSKCNRLKLEKIVKYGGNSDSNLKEEHTFTYYEDVKLPPLNFGKKDAFGYSNGLGNLSLLSSEIKKPKLYEYTENLNSGLQRKYSSPFYISALNPIQGDGEDMSSNLVYTRAWSLKSITYPNKGIQEFEYELNTFKWKESFFSGGGLRIKNILLKDNNIVTQNIAYSYLDENNETSGNLIADPKFSGPQFTSNSKEYRTISSSAIYELTKGNNVGYKMVTVSKTNNGKIVKQFNNPANYPNSEEKYLSKTEDFTQTPTYFPERKTSIEDNDFLRGSVINEKIIDSAGALLKNTDFIYKATRKDSIIVIEKPYDIITGQSFQRFVFKRNNLTQKREKNNYSNGYLENITNYTYNDDYNTLKKVSFTYPDNNVVDKLFYYPQDFNLYPELLNQFRIGEQIKTEIFNNNIQTYETFVKFEKNANTSNLVLPTENHVSKGFEDIIPSSAENRKIVYNKYDNKGNILEYSGENAIPISYIWGYKNEYPIAKIENAIYSIIPASLISTAQLASDSGNETQLKSALNAIRNTPELANAMVTTHTYIPLVGISSTTDPAGNITTYNYDNFGRLQNVKDKDGNILSENQYNYKQ